MISAAQRQICFLLAASMFACAATVVLLAHFTRVLPDLLDREIARMREIDGVYLYDGGYVDDADYVLLGLLPRADHHNGGVFFIGDSQLRAAFMPTELPASEQALIRNYSIGDLHHRDQRYFIKMLVDEFGLLDGGAEHTTIVLGISHNMARPRVYADGSYVNDAFQRHGLYTYPAGAGAMHRSPMPAPERFVRVQHDIASRFLLTVSGLRASRVKPFTPALRTVRAIRLDDNWREAMVSEVHELSQLLDYLRARRVRVIAIISPSGSWERQLPYERAYLDMVEPVFAARNMRLIDQTRLLSDEEIADNTHPTYRGRIRLQAIDRALALQALEDMGMRPASEAR
jgi:hypothetical protein